MTDVIDMKVQKRRLAAKKGFQAWSRRFSESFNENTCMEDLSDLTLSKLIRGGEEASMPLYELIMGIYGMGMGPKFYFLDSPEMMGVMDVALFLLDQLRFEAMKRLGWVEEGLACRVPLLDLVQQFPERYSSIKHQTPPLSSEHSAFNEYMETFEGDRGSFIRRLIPDAIEAFQSRYREC